ncbi:MAG: AAA family ATPase [Saprospiraceae bacterium]
MRILCKTIIGTAAEGSKYFSRKRIETLILRSLCKGNFVHFTAPRRTGKTSILKELANTHYEDLICIYEDIESDKTSTDLYIRLIKLIEKSLKKSDTWRKSIWTIITSKKIKGINVLDGRIDLDDKIIDHKQVFLDLVSAISESEAKIVLFLDEFPDVINNIRENEGAETALNVLHTLRSLRQTSDFNQQFSLVFSGSVGLTHIVRKIGRSKLLNDLKVIELEPLTSSEFDEFIHFLTDKASMYVPIETRNHIQKKLLQLIPYYIQLIIEKGDEWTEDHNSTTLSIEDVDQVYQKLITESDKFIDWVDRIKTYFSDHSKFLMQVLTNIAHQDQMVMQEVLNIANQHKEEEFEELIHQVLIADGYLTKNESGKLIFASPLLRDWWKYHYSLTK